MNIFFRMFQHLLPNARAWRLTIEKTLRNFFEGLSGIGADAVDYADLVWLDIFPNSTRELDEWELQFALPDTILTEATRRTRLNAHWKALGGQDKKYIEDTLRGAGFDVFVHEWWVPGTEPVPGVKLCVTPRNPLTVLRPEFTDVSNTFVVQCDEALAECGEAFAEMGNSIDPLGYPLVNKLSTTVDDLTILCGEAFAECGEAEAECGQFINFIFTPVNYIVPTDPLKWPYFLYIGGETFGDIATIVPSRRDEFETLALKICPAQQWLGILVTF